MLVNFRYSSELTLNPTQELKEKSDLIVNMYDVPTYVNPVVISVKCKCLQLRMSYLTKLYEH